MGQSMATVKPVVMMSVSGMSRYLRICLGVSGVSGEGKYGTGETLFAVKAKCAPNLGLGGSDK